MTKSDGRVIYYNMKMKNPRDVDEVKAYVSAGNAVFTLYSEKLDKRYTYKIQVAKNANMFSSVSVSYEYGHYRFIGWFRADELIINGNNIEKTKESFKMIKYFFEILRGERAWPETCRFYKSDRCARCGRLLTTPASILSGYGPECEKYMFNKG